MRAANVSTGASMEIDVKGVAGAQNIFAEIAMLVGILNGFFEDQGLVVILATNIEVAGTRSDGIAGDRDPFHEQERGFFDDNAILAGTRFTFVGVHDHVLRLVAGLRNEAPLHAGWEAGATTAA